MRLLLVDNSNTRTKLALASRDALLGWRSVIATPDVSPASLRASLRGVEWDAGVISSVVPDKAAVLTDFLSDKPCHILGHESKLPIGIDYPDPGQIGADRLANAAAASVMFGSPAIVLDFGTAVTFDVLGACRSAGAAYLGGVIAPGLASMTEGLARRTALLPHIELREPDRAIGKSTEQAMLAGSIHGYRGLVREIIRQIRAELSGEPTVIATGGDAPLISRGLPEIHHHCPQLTLEGLRMIGGMNC